MEHIYTIPINESFERCAEDKSCGCPMCDLYNRLEDNELELILGASMMEPDIRIKTNKEGFCRTHYDMMFVRKNRLGMALTLESHISELISDLHGTGLLAKPGEKQAKRISALESSCYVCKRIDFHFEHIIENIVYMWDADESFRKKFNAQPYFCLPHYRRLIECASARLAKKRSPELIKEATAVVESYLKELGDDVSWFCKKFDYRYDEEPWYNSKDAVERSIKFLRSDLHNPPDQKKK